MKLYKLNVMYQVRLGPQRPFVRPYYTTKKMSCGAGGDKKTATNSKIFVKKDFIGLSRFCPRELYGENLEHPSLICRSY